MADEAPRSWLEEQLEFRIVELSKPIRVNGEVVTKLRIREPVARDLRVAKKVGDDEDTKFQAILASCTGVPLHSIGMLRISDYKACAEALASMGFTETPPESPDADSDGSPGTGKTH